jgi:8-oxoguanine deaminase
LKTWIKNPLAVWTGNELSAPDGLLIEDSLIKELVVGTPSSYDQVFDASNRVILPGLINCHHHFYQTLTRALPQAANQKLFPWLQSLYPIWANLTPDAIKASSELAIAELLLSGCTTVSDHHYVFSDQLSDSIDIQIQAAKKLGIRAVFCRGSMSLGESSGGLPPDSIIQTEDQILLDSERLLNQYHDQSEQGAMVQIALAPCSPFSVTPKLMSNTAELAATHGARLHTHLAETEDENRFCEDTFNMRPLDYLESRGWLHENTWLAHGIHFNDQEINRLGYAGTGICYCPTSNMILGSGTCRSLELEAAGSPVGLGVDGSASNDGSNLMQEARQALLLARLYYGADRMTVDHSLRWLSTGGARLLGRADIGQIAPAMQADLALFSLDDLRFSGAADPLAALIMCGAHTAEHVMVAGAWRVLNQQLVDTDLAQIKADHQRAATSLLSKAQS